MKLILLSTWLAIVSLAAFSYNLSSRIDTLSYQEQLPVPVSTTTTSTTTTTPILPELQRQILELQANRGLTGPEVRELVETILPEPTTTTTPTTVP